MSNIVVGIDPSISSTALVCLKDNKVFSQLLIKTNKIKMKVVTREDDLKLKIKKMVTIFIKSYQFLKLTKPSVICIEGYSYGGVRNLTSQAEVVSILLFAAYKYMSNIKDSEVRLIIVQPTQLKKFITGNGTAKKELMLKEVYKLFDFDVQNNNIADAFCLAKVAFYFYLYEIEKKNLRKDLNSYQIKVIKDLLKIKKRRSRK